MHYIVKTFNNNPYVWKLYRVEDTTEKKEIGYSSSNLIGELDYCAVQINNLLAEVVKLQKEVEIRDLACAEYLKRLLVTET